MAGMILHMNSSHIEPLLEIMWAVSRRNILNQLPITTNNLIPPVIMHIDPPLHPETLIPPLSESETYLVLPPSNFMFCLLCNRQPPSLFPPVRYMHSSAFPDKQKNISLAVGYSASRLLPSTHLMLFPSTIPKSNPQLSHSKLLSAPLHHIPLTHHLL